MVTKLKNNLSLIGSIVAIILALLSIGYCFSIVLLVIENSWDKSAKMLSFIARMIGGSYPNEQSIL